MGDDPRIVALTPSDTAEVLELDQWAFFFDLDDADRAPMLDVLEWDRMFGARLPDRGGEPLAGVNGAYSFRLPVPGGEVAAAGLSWVGVHPQFRRRGVMRAMVQHHLGEVRRRGEPVSVLTASEATIYGRYGYGPGVDVLWATIPRGAGLRDVPGADDVPVRMERAEVARHAALAGACYEAARTRPGMLSRSTPAWHRRILEDRTADRKGKEALRIMIAGDGDPARGYALFRRAGAWDGAVADGSVEVREVVARDPAAARALWGRLVDLDLTARVAAPPLATDDALLHLLEDVRAIRPAITDAVWVRLVDVPAALAARRYPAELDVVLEVRDEACPWNQGRWRLDGGPDGAECRRTGDTPDISLDVRELGAAYLGSTSLAALASAGRVNGEPSSVQRAATAFHWPVAAYCGFDF